VIGKYSKFDVVLIGEEKRGGILRGEIGLFASTKGRKEGRKEQVTNVVVLLRKPQGRTATSRLGSLALSSINHCTIIFLGIMYIIKLITLFHS
jgi:hypothetical protein